MTREAMINEWADEMGISKYEINQVIRGFEMNTHELKRQIITNVAGLASPLNDNIMDNVIKETVQATQKLNEVGIESLNPKELRGYGKHIYNNANLQYATAVQKCYDTIAETIENFKG